MQEVYRNIYKTARKAAGLTQERWAEQLGISTESVRLYESGRGLPSDEIAARMAEAAGMPILGYWHLKEKSCMANDMLPDIPAVALPQAVVGLLVAIRDFRENLEELLTIAADGMVSEEESGLFEAILDELEGVVSAAMAVKYASRERR